MTYNNTSYQKTDTSYKSQNIQSSSGDHTTIAIHISVVSATLFTYKASTYQITMMSGGAEATIMASTCPNLGFSN